MDATLTLPLRLTVAGDTIAIDFTGAPPQLAQGGVNSTLNYTAAHATYPLKCMLTPDGARQCRLLPPVHGHRAGGFAS